MLPTRRPCLPCLPSPSMALGATRGEQGTHTMPRCLSTPTRFMRNQPLTQAREVRLRPLPALLLLAPLPLPLATPEEPPPRYKSSSPPLACVEDAGESSE